MIEEYKAVRPRAVRGTTIEAGQQLYAIRKGFLYFIWSYSDRAFAEQMDAKLEGPENQQEREANWRAHLGDLVPSDRTSFK